MIAPICSHEKLTKHGRDRKGQQRWKCARCGQTVTRNMERPLGSMRIEMADAAKVLGMLLEGMSIRACQRLTGMKIGTICDLVVHVGDNCGRLLETTITGVAASFVEMDELWSFVGMKAKTAERKNLGPEVGDSWTWLAIDADSKMILAHAVGQRDQSTCERFLKRLNSATIGPMQVTSDGLGLYTYNVPYALGSRVDFAQLIKSYSSSQEETRYSPAKIMRSDKVARFGSPDMERVSTSYAERLNLSVRMHNRRFTRLTNAHSKSAIHHEAMINIFVAWYNFCRRNEALKKQTPAMSSGLTAAIWSIEDLLRNAANY
ncbi:MAG TPA: IS1 family transposase [Pirellulales bacterium]|jgi:transposase-like protein/IS1 family transposase|nr:IS1 family transposase [Pirellulales bacterium]